MTDAEDNPNPAGMAGKEMKMTLVVSDRSDGSQRAIDFASDRKGFQDTVRHLAEHFGEPIDDVREGLVCGNTYRTAGFEYTLVD